MQLVDSMIANNLRNTVQGMADNDEPADFANDDIGDDGDNDFEPVFDTIDADQTQTTDKQVNVMY